MIITLIVVCEVGFWLLLAAGLAARYLLRMPRTGLALLLCEPLLEVLLLVVTAMDLRNGADPSWRHGLAAVYIGFTVGHGHRTVKWLDGHAAHRFGGAPPPPKPPRYGMARARYEGVIWLGTVVAAAVASGLLLLAMWYVGGDGNTDGLRETIGAVWRAAGIHGLIALGYAIRPKKDPKAGSALPARDPEHVPDLLVRGARKDEEQV
ncbi:MULTISPECIES: hypothetical protein [unclassified Streptomyces]|uniref:hypothetical protein n=1 Tax=unclassified Streptomyces TaxID=2593676 RepID=UPI001661087C|nr:MULTISPECIES: hypothetical protein [unclassified Streptomyces]MBD0710154.1 hypothetical protein [Streptomyces sp. CBMA291]MBD0715584.1 hypothetical protein [Streptomyces sp. CBMA370]